MSDDNLFQNSQDVISFLLEIQKHQDYTAELQKIFNTKCDDVKNKTQKKIRLTDKNDKNTLQKILEEEEKQLNSIVAEFKTKAGQSNKKAREKLEEIENNREKSEFDLERELIAI